MKFTYIVFLNCIFIYSTTCIAQHSTLSLGVKGGIGYSVPDPNSSAEFNGKSYSLRTNAYYIIGMAIQYTLGYFVGIETGILSTTSSCAIKDPTVPSIQQSLGWSSNIPINSFQVPFQLMYIIRLRRHPNMRIKLTGGIAMDWLMSRYAYQKPNPLFVPSLLFGARIKSRTGKYGHMEYSLEYQYSLQDINLEVLISQGTPLQLHSGYSILSFNLYYFFLSRDR